jgi:hypothetical protein
MDFMYPEPVQDTQPISVGAMPLNAPYPYAFQRVEPDLADIIHYLIGAIASHPKVQHPGIYVPVVEGDIPGPREEVLIEEYREYGGIVLDQPGLTCAVYPFYSPRNPESEAPTRPTIPQSVRYSPYTLGRPGPGSQDLAMFNIVVELSMQGVALGGDAFTTIRTIPEAPDLIQKHHGYRVALVEGDGDYSKDDALRALNPRSFPRFQQVRYRVNPAEQILRRYASLMRTVIHELPCLLPFTTRKLCVENVDFCTSPWNQNANIYFHVVSLHCTLEMYISNA